MEAQQSSSRCWQMVVIMLHTYRVRLDLHSFPTRRSSDLDQRGRPDAVAGRHRRPAAGAPDAPIPRVDLDRKCTRLNSSHVKSSYADFCLKKIIDGHTRRHDVTLLYVSDYLAIKIRNHGNG